MGYPRFSSSRTKVTALTSSTIGPSFQYSHTIGRAEYAGKAFRTPVAIALGRQDRIYVLNRSYEYRSDGKRITICTLDEEFISEFGKGIILAGKGEESAADGCLI